MFWQFWRWRRGGIFVVLLLLFIYLAKQFFNLWRVIWSFMRLNWTKISSHQLFRISRQIEKNEFKKSEPKFTRIDAHSFYSLAILNFHSVQIVGNIIGKQKNFKARFSPEQQSGKCILILSEKSGKRFWVTYQLKCITVHNFNSMQFESKVLV